MIVGAPRAAGQAPAARAVAEAGRVPNVTTWVSCQRWTGRPRQVIHGMSSPRRQPDGFLGATPPRPCRTPVLLVINAGGSRFAAGIPKD